MEQQEYAISLSGVSEDEANRYVSELQEAVLDAVPGVKADRKKERHDTQDFGATLIVALGTPTVYALAQALGDWLRLRHQVGLEVTKPDGTRISLTNATSKDAADVMERLRDP